MLDYLIIGAGPAGLACAIEAAKKGASYLVVDKGCLVNSIFHFPADITFFSTPDLLQIADLVFVSPSFRPSRVEVLKYYAAVADHYALNINTFEKVEEVTKTDGVFHVRTITAASEWKDYKAAKVIFATGYYDNPNMLKVPGEHMPHVSHYYGEAHPFRGRDVAVIGAKNSAVEAALSFWRAGARVTIIHRGPAISDSVKYWVRPDIEKRVETGQIKAMFNTAVTFISSKSVTAQNSATGESMEIAADFVFALTGYHPDTGLLQSCGVDIDEITQAPQCDPATLETNVPGLYVAGSIVAGVNNNKIFIENSREHGKMIVREGSA